jgi:hypothetical protein
MKRGACHTPVGHELMLVSEVRGKSTNLTLAGRAVTKDYRDTLIHVYATAERMERGSGSLLILFLVNTFPSRIGIHEGRRTRLGGLMSLPSCVQPRSARCH